MLQFIEGAGVGIIIGAFIAWNNTKSSIKGKIDAAISVATKDIADAFSALKAKL